MTMMMNQLVAHLQTLRPLGYDNVLAIARRAFAMLTLEEQAALGLVLEDEEIIRAAQLVGVIRRELTRVGAVHTLHRETERRAKRTKKAATCHVSK